MPDVLNYDTPIRPIRPGDTPPPADRVPVPVPPTFASELRKLFVGLLGR